MGKRIRRKNEGLLKNIRAVIMGAITALGMIALGLEPTWVALATGAAVSLIALRAVDAAAMIAVVAISVPLVAGNPVLGISFALSGVVCVHYLGANGGQPFLVIALAVIGAKFGLAWAAVIIAGYALGASDGAILAAAACVFVETIGLALGKELWGAIAIGGSKSTALLSIQTASASMFTAEWAKGLIGKLDPQAFKDLGAMFTGATYTASLVGQPVVWAAAALTSASLGRQARRRKSTTLAVVAVLVSGLLVVIGSAVLASMDHAKPGAGSQMFAFAVSVLVAGMFAVVWDRAFRLERIVQKSKGSAFSMAAEDADVDELLSLISTAEEKLANDHAAERVVMITDMKSFSRMTEEDGSMVTAKAIQRHRDLLLPVVTDHGGHGKSTGGDGLLAAFPSAKDAISSAIDMQNTLAAYSAAHPKEREMTIRIGIAEGEVMLDKNGRPFIGAALNLAARVMNLADGGQIFVAAETAHHAGDVFCAQSHGQFELKNIAVPVEIHEILWAAGQEPADPRTRES